MYALLAATLLGGFPAFEETHQFPPELQRRALAATVRIRDLGQNITGTGTIVRRDERGCLILTAHHVVNHGPWFEIELFAEKSYPSPAVIFKDGIQVVASRPENDLAFLRLDTDKPLPEPMPIYFGHPPLTPPFAVFSLGCSQGCQPTLRYGQVVAVKQSPRLSCSSYRSTTPGIPGRSGGALVNTDGYVCGVLARYDSTPGSDGLYVGPNSIRILCSDLSRKEDSVVNVTAGEAAILGLKILLAKIVVALVLRRYAS